VAHRRYAGYYTIFIIFWLDLQGDLLQPRQDKDLNNKETHIKNEV